MNPEERCKFYAANLPISPISNVSSFQKFFAISGIGKAGCDGKYRQDGILNRQDPCKKRPLPENSHVNLWIKAAAILGAIWLCILCALWVIKQNTPTPDKLDAYIRKNPIANLSGEKRTEVIAKVEKQLNLLNYPQRRQMSSKRRELDGFFRQLTPAEQETFLDNTLPSGFREMMEALNKMSPEKRRRLVERALGDMEKGRPEDEATRDMDDPHIQKIIKNGMASFYRDANAETKLDFAPVIEAIQARTQNLR